MEKVINKVYYNIYKIYIKFYYFEQIYLPDFFAEGLAIINVIIS